MELRYRADKSTIFGIMILWDITSNFIRGTFVKKSKTAPQSKMAVKSSKLCSYVIFSKILTSQSKITT